MAGGWVEALCWVLLARQQHVVVGVGSLAGFPIYAISAPYQKIPAKMGAFCLDCWKSCS